jgi:hypothetical protein
MDEKTLAVIKIQKKWLQFHFNKIVQSFLLNGPIISYVKSINFESIIIFLRNNHDIIKKCFQKIYLLSVYTIKSPIKNINYRIFSGSYIIAYFPTNVFTSMGTLEQELFDVALSLTVKFENICNIIKSYKYYSFELCKDFIDILHQYLTKYNAWKIVYEHETIYKIKHTLIALYHRQLQINTNNRDDLELSIEINTQILRLRNHFEKIAGIDALNIFEDEQRYAISLNRIMNNEQH